MTGSNESHVSSLGERFRNAAVESCGRTAVAPSGRAEPPALYAKEGAEDSSILTYCSSPMNTSCPLPLASDGNNDVHEESQFAGFKKQFYDPSLIGYHTTTSLTAGVFSAIDSRRCPLKSATHGHMRHKEPNFPTSFPTARRGARLTIFSEDFIKHVEKERGSKGEVKTMLHSTAGYLLQICVFGVMVLMLGMTPVIKESALWDETLKKKVQNFVPQTPYILHFGLSVAIANMCSYLRYGGVGVKDCWDLSSIVYVGRVSIFYAIGESMEMFTLLYVDGTTWKIMNQIKLPLTALLSYVLLGRRQTGTQFTLIMSVTIVILAYCTAVSRGAGSSNTASTIGLAIAFVNVLIVTIAGIVADYTYKEVKYPFFILIAQGRISACICTVVLMVIYQVYTQRFESFFYGWQARTFLLTFWLLAKDWSVTFVLRNLDATWKAVGTALGLCVTYTVSNVILRWNVDFSILILVVAVVVNVVAYTLAKRDEYNHKKELDVLIRQMDKQRDSVVVVL